MQLSGMTVLKKGLFGVWVSVRINSHQSEILEKFHPTERNIPEA